ncbi:MAG: hypothetical protein ACLGIJ_08005 [Candidatus Limnocylindria bacterium]
MSSLVGAGAGWPQLVRLLLYVAMALFVVTIVIGILNGLDLVEFDRDQILTHVHSGTLGWVTLSLVAAAVWLFRSDDRRMVLAFAALIAVYVVAFYVGDFALRAVTGLALFVAIAWLVVWAWRRYLAERTLPGLAVALGITTFTYGAVIGTLLQVQFATGTPIFPSGADVIGAHAGTMVFSYLILVSMGLMEWRLRGTTDHPVAGLIQYVALFLGGLLLAVVSLFAPDQLQAIGGIYLLVQIVAVGLFAVRILPAALRVDRGSAAGRHLATASVFVIVAMAIFLYLVSQFLADPTLPFEELAGLVVASDHAAFIGVVSNLSIALALTLTADRRDGGPAVEWLVWLAINLGLLVFLVGLVSESAELKRIGAPVMGIGLLVGLGVVAVRLRASDLRGGEA